MHWKFLLATVLALLAIISWTASREGEGHSSFEEAREMIIMREIGHKVLLYAGDSASRVLPVQQAAHNEYRLRFETDFTFQPDSLVDIIHRIITAHKLPQHYIVKVMECAGSEVIYGYAITGNRETSIVPCLRRNVEKSCYTINILFPGAEEAGINNNYYLLGSGLLLMLVSFFAVRSYTRRKKEPAPVEEESTPAAEDGPPSISIGKYLFYYDQQLLVLDEERITLTVKEAKLLNIFAAAPGQVIDRNRLQEIWEEEGVIVGRSLDMFVSKLRKKLQGDPSVRIINVHGKGYKLVSAAE